MSLPGFEPVALMLNSSKMKIITMHACGLKCSTCWRQANPGTAQDRTILDKAGGSTMGRDGAVHSNAFRHALRG